MIHDLKHLKIGQVAVLTGDREPVARRVARKVHVKIVEAELLPADKARWIKEQQEAGQKVAMVGDGINDAPALAQADAGIALGGMGADLAAEAGDLIILGDPLRNLPALVELARATVSVIRQNIIIFAFGLNALAVVLASLGILQPVAAAILHQVGSLLVLLNAMRLLVFGDWAEMPPFRQLRALGERISRIDDRLDFGPVWRWLVRSRKAIAGGCAVLCWRGFTQPADSRPSDPARSAWCSGSAAIAECSSRGCIFRLPAPIEQVTRLEPARVRSLRIGFARSGQPRGEWLRWENPPRAKFRV